MNLKKSTKVYAIGIDRRIIVFRITLAVLIVLFGTYATLLNLTIANIVSVEESSKIFEREKVQLSLLEEQYLKESQKLTVENAYSMGLVADKDPNYIKVTLINGAVTLNTDSR